jgi:multimeric flavodoxin WrbA
MKILIVYGGNNMADDLSLVAVERIHTVLEELEVDVKRFDLDYSDITEEFMDELRTSDGVVLATTVKWIGIGGKMQAFLDRCFFSGQKDVFENKYLMSVVLTNGTGDRDASNYLIKCWDMLGGLEGTNICGKIEKSVQLETNERMISIIDKKTEDFYRIINQKRDLFPTGTYLHNEKSVQKDGVMTDQEANIFDELIGDDFPGTKKIEEDSTIIKQRQDIKDITNFFKQKLTNNDIMSENKYIDKFLQAFKCNDLSFECTYNIILLDTKQNIILKVKNNNLVGLDGTDPLANVVINVESEILDEIINGRLTIQRAFLTGQLKAKGNFTWLYEIDNIFEFSNKNF